MHSRFSFTSKAYPKIAANWQGGAALIFAETTVCSPAPVLDDKV